MTRHITVTLSHFIDANTGRVDSKPRATFLGHDDASFDFLRRNVRGYRGPTHPAVTLPYARKIQRIAAAVGVEVTVKENPKATPAEARAAIEGFRQQCRSLMEKCGED
jgi:hypothetical protein